MSDAVLAPLGQVVACRDCDGVQCVPDQPWGGNFSCFRCGGVLVQRRHRDLDFFLAVTLGLAVLFFLAASQTFLTIDVHGTSQDCTMYSGVLALADAGFIGLAGLVGFTLFGAPCARIIGLLYVLVPLRAGRLAPRTAEVFRWVQKLGPWAMLDVLVLAVIVAAVKLGELASIELGPGMAAFLGLVVLWTVSRDRLDPTWVFEAVAPTVSGVGPGRTACEVCGQGVALDGGDVQKCSRCGGRVHARKPDSLARTTALVAGAALLYVPANFYPILNFETLGVSGPQTILSSVGILFASGMWPIASILFFASILVPLFKLVGLSTLIAVVRRGSGRPVEATRMFRLIDYIGRWSMIDVLVLALLVSLVQMGSVATITPGIGATCFGAVVVLTILGAQSFDPRLIWDTRRKA
jgi:paraquat-inducible protein A